MTQEWINQAVPQEWQSQSAVDAGMAQTQGNDTGFAQSQPGSDMAGTTQDQGKEDGGSGDGDDNGDGGDNGGGDGDDSEDKDEED